MGKFLNLIHAIGGLTIPVVSSAATPVAGEVSLYAKSDGNVYKKTSDGVEVAVTGVSGGGSALSAWPVGSIFMSTTSTNPATLLGGGTWSAWGTGKVPIAIDTNDTDFNTVEKIGGSKTTTIAAANLPKHTHDMGHHHDSDVTGAAGSGGTFTRGQTTGAATYARIAGGVVDFAGNTGDGGFANTPMNTMPPYITCYMWKRTA